MSSASSSPLTERGEIWNSTEIVFPYVLEDADAEYSCIEIWTKENPGQRASVLQVASSGDTAIALASHPAVDAVYAVDINEAQLHWCHLKAAAFVSLLSTSDFIRFVANENADADSSEETKSFRASTLASLSSSLPPLTSAYWLRPSSSALLLSPSVYASGFRQRDLPALNDRLKKDNLHPYFYKQQQQGEDGQEGEEEKKKRWDTAWKESFKVAPGVVLGNMVWRFVPPSSWPLLSSSSSSSSSVDEGVKVNWFIQSFFGRYLPSPVSNRPRYLRVHGDSADADASVGASASASVSAATTKKRAIVDKIKFELCEMSKFIDEQKKTFSFVHVSTVLDGLKDDARHAFLTKIVQALPVGGLALFRTGPFPIDLTAGSPSGLRVLVDRYLTVDHALSDQLKQNEVCKIYFDVVVARKRPT